MRFQAFAVGLHEHRPNSPRGGPTALKQRKQQAGRRLRLHLSAIIAMVRYSTISFFPFGVTTRLLPSVWMFHSMLMYQCGTDSVDMGTMGTARLGKNLGRCSDWPKGAFGSFGAVD